MPKTSLETINGELCTVIRKPFDAEAVRKSLAIGAPVVAEHEEFGLGLVGMLAPRGSLTFHGFQAEQSGFNNGFEFARDYEMACVVTILPALPKHPKPEETALLYRYASEGIFARGDTKSWVDGERGGYWIRENDSWLLGVGAAYIYEITHAVDADDNRVEVAIKGE